MSNKSKIIREYVGRIKKDSIKWIKIKDKTLNWLILKILGTELIL